MAEIKLKVGSVVRLTSFANKPADGSEPKGFSASPEDAPADKRNVFVCMLLAIEPELLEGADAAHEEAIVEKALADLGYSKTPPVTLLPGFGSDAN